MQPSTDLSEDVERMFKLDFSEHHIGLGDTKMSIEDKMALTKIKNSTVFTDAGKYQVSTPFRDNGERILDSHTMDAYGGSVSRLKWLKKRFLKNPSLLDKYKASMIKLKNKGNVRIISKTEINHESGWYLPHHPAFHPMKPDTVRIVLDCAAKFGGTSLNDQLLQGPDLNNLSLIHI